MLPTDLLPDETEGKILKVRMIQKEGLDLFDPVHLFDEGSTVSWIPCGRKLTCSFPGIKFHYGPEEWCGAACSVRKNAMHLAHCATQDGERCHGTRQRALCTLTCTMHAQHFAWDCRVHVCVPAILTRGRAG